MVQDSEAHNTETGLNTHKEANTENLKEVIKKDDFYNSRIISFFILRT